MTLKPRVLEINVVDNFRNWTEAGSSTGHLIKPSSLQRSPSCVNSASNISNRI